MRVAAFGVGGVEKVAAAIVIVARSLFSRVGDGSHLPDGVVGEARTEPVRVGDSGHIAVRVVFEVAVGINVVLTDAAQKNGFTGQEGCCRVITAHYLREPVFERVLDFSLGDAPGRVERVHRSSSNRISDCFLHSGQVVFEDRLGTARLDDLLQFAVWKILKPSAVDLPRVFDAGDMVGIGRILVEIGRDIITVRGAVSETPDLPQAPVGIVEVLNRGLGLGAQCVDRLGYSTRAIAFQDQRLATVAL